MNLTGAARKPYAFELPEYWEAMARSERSAAAEDRSRRHGTSESIRIHRSNAADYEARAKAIREAA